MKLNQTLIQAALCATALGFNLPAAAQSETAPAPRVIVKWNKKPAASNAGKISAKRQEYSESFLRKIFSYFEL